MQHAREFAEAGIPFVFDPGQGMPMFSGAELLDFHRAGRRTSPSTITKPSMLQDKTGKTLERYRPATSRR